MAKAARAKFNLNEMPSRERGGDQEDERRMGIRKYGSLTKL